jgi:putative membrane protein
MSFSFSATSATIKELFMGFCLGVANIIPGVSGGTFLLVFGIYERVFSILNQINKSFVLKCLELVSACFRCPVLGIKHVYAFSRESGFLFLFKLAAGAVVAILALSSLMKYLLLHHFCLTYSFFFGLILVSVIIPVKMLKRFDTWAMLCLVAGIGITVWVSAMVNPYDKIKMKSDHLARTSLIQSASAEGRDDSVPGSGKIVLTIQRYSSGDYLYIAFCGALAISATVLPGVSGSLVLILMGTYFEVISAISELKCFHLETFIFLGIFGLGVIFGGLLFARLVSFVFFRHYNATMAFLCGLMTGSLYALWPFKKTVFMAQQYVKQAGEVVCLENVTVQTNINILPTKDDPVIAAFVFFVLGGIIMMLFVRKEAAASAVDQ